MVKHTQTIPWQLPDELFECVFVGLGLKGLRIIQRGSELKNENIQPQIDPIRLPSLGLDLFP